MSLSRQPAGERNDFSDEENLRTALKIQALPYFERRKSPTRFHDEPSLIPLYRLQCTASRAWAVAHHQNAGSDQHVSAARAIRRIWFVLVAVLHDALVACPDGA